MIDIRFSTLDEEKDIKQLWINGFGEDRSYYPLFRSYIYNPQNIIVLTESQKIVSMLSIMPTTITAENGRDYSTSNFYAITTLTKYRGKGYASKLIEFAINHVLGEGFQYITLCPASNFLFDFYTKLGFKASFSSCEISIPSQKISNELPSYYSVSSADISGYLKARNIRLDGNLFINWDKRQLDYAKQISKFEGGDMLFIKLLGATCLATVQRCKNDTVAIKELLAPEDLFEYCLAAIKKRYPATTYIVRCPATYKVFPSDYTRKFGMVYASESAPIVAEGYYGFAFD